MVEISKLGSAFKEKLALKYFPIGFYYSDNKPEKFIGFKKSGECCIMPLILKSAMGNIAAFDENSMGYPCSSFFLGYSEWIFPGIENYLSNGSMTDRECERFVKTPQQAKEYLESLINKEKPKKFAIFKPLESFTKDEKPEIVIFFTNPDQLSALVYLLYFNAPQEENRVVTGFASACAAVTTLPLKHTRNGGKKAVWGLHDISARAKLPENLMTISMPFNLVNEIYDYMDESFLITEQWKQIVDRIKK